MEVALSQDTARGNELLLTLGLSSGQKLLFGVDTGSPVTLLDKSLEPMLGKRLGSTTVLNFGSKERAEIYTAPALYLGDIQLKTGRQVVVIDFTAKYAHFEDRHPLGILGMDCLKHYCIQMDFEAGKMRFFNSRALSATNLGKVFPLFFSSQDQDKTDLIRPYVHTSSLIGGASTEVLVDTGYRVDGALDSPTFHQEIATRRGGSCGAVTADNGRVWFSNSMWNGETLTNLLLGEGGNLIGLGFLARHLVTLDFPNRVMYLKQTSVGPPTDKNLETAEAFLNSLKNRGQLPGWSNHEKGTIYLEPFPNSFEFDGRKQGSSSDYHYKIDVESPSGALKLTKAWRTNEHADTMEDYTIP